MDTHELKRALHEILSEFERSLPDEQLESMRSLASAGECGVALENLCMQLYEFDIKVSEHTRSRLQLIGRAMNVEPEYWERLSIG